MAARIMIDPGHAPGNVNAGKNGYKEYAGMWKLSNYLKTALERSGCTVGLTRTEDADTELRTRGARSAGYDLFISEHSNAFNGTVRGVEVYYSVMLPGDKAFAAAISKAAAQLMDNPDRGAKTRAGSSGGDYYAVIDSAQKIGTPHVLLVENGFHDNTVDEAFLLSDLKLKQLAEVQAKVICAFLQCMYVEEGSAAAGTPILFAPTAVVSQMQSWARSKNATINFIGLAEIFFKLAVGAGVNPVAAYCQSAKETAYGRFGGVLDETYCNPCGMKNTSGGGDYDASAHKRFYDWQEGISAQIDHLALYAGAPGYPRVYTADPRHFSYLHGTAKTVEELGGRWAPSTEYGRDIVGMMRALEATPLPAVELPEADISTVALAIGGITTYVPADNINGFWYITLADCVKVRLRDILEILGYGLTWDESRRAIIADLRDYDEIKLF